RRPSRAWSSKTSRGGCRNGRLGERLQTRRTEAVGVSAPQVGQRGGVEFHVAAPTPKEASTVEGQAALRTALFFREHRGLPSRRPLDCVMGQFAFVRQGWPGRTPIMLTVGTISTTVQIGAPAWLPPPSRRAIPPLADDLTLTTQRM